MKNKTVNIYRSMFIAIFITLAAWLAITASANHEYPDGGWIVTATAAARTAAGECQENPGEVCKELCMYNPAIGSLNPTGQFKCQPE